jgi:DNA-binding Lrp family transcriptional regulator
MPTFKDDLDRAIVSLLEEDGRLPNLEIARRLRVSESTVRKRIARLMRQTGLRILASLGDRPHTEMLFLIHTEPGCRVAVAERLAALPNVQQISLTTGSYDIVARAAFRSDADALAFLVQEVEGGEGVRSVQVSHVLKNLTPVPGRRAAATLATQPAQRAALDTFVLEAARLADLTAVLELGCDAAIAGLGADRVAIYRINADHQLEHAASRGLSREYLRAIEERITPRIGVGIRVVNTRVHVFVEDVLISPLMAGVRDLARREGYRTLLFLPLLYGEELVGLLGLYNDAVRRYSDDEIALAQAFADQLAIAIVRSRTRLPAAKPLPERSSTPAETPIDLLIERLTGQGP